jgi:hypothetical protein
MQHRRATIEAASQVPDEVRVNIRELSGFAVQWEAIAAAVKLPVEVCRVVCGLPPLPAPSGKPVLSWESESRQKSLFD